MFHFFSITLFIHSINIITREMQSINGASIRVLDSSIERIVFKTFES